MHGSRPVLIGEMRHTVPCSIPKTWRELFCIFFCGAPQNAVASLQKMTTSGFQLLMVTVLGKHRTTSAAFLWVALGYSLGDKAAQALQ